MSDVLRLCHGLKYGIEEPVKLFGSAVNDSGRGFYLCDEPLQFLTLICRGGQHRKISED